MIDSIDDQKENKLKNCLRLEIKRVSPQHIYEGGYANLVI